MSFAQFKSVFRSLRFRLMLWNAVIMLIASLGLLWGLRAGVHYTLLAELDDDLRDDFGEVSLALVNVFDANSRFFHAQMDRKARGHVQRSWFVQLVEFQPRRTSQSPPRQSSDLSATELADDPRSVRRSSRSRRPSRTGSSNRSSGPGSLGAETSPDTQNSPETQNSPDTQRTAAPSVDVASADVASAGEASAAGAADKPGELSVAGPPPNGVLRESAATEAAQQIAAVNEPVAIASSSGPRIIWQSFNVPDWTTLDVPPDFDHFVLPDGIATTVDDYRVLEKTVHNARRGPIRVRIGASLRSIEHASMITDQLMLFNVFISLVIAPLGGYWLALRATRPLNAMIRTTDRLRPQQMDERLPIRHTEDELDQLSVAFNRLLDRIAEYLTKRQDLLANSAHELRTPLAALRSTAELALGTERTADEYRELLELIVSECGNLEQLVNQLLLLSETESAHFDSRGEVVDLTKITNEACDMFGAVAESRGVTLSTKIADGIVVDGSRMHLRQLLNNLIDNAIKFIPGEGQVSVALQSTPAGHCLKVRDTGIGMAEDEQRRLFERFYRGDRARRRHTPTRGTGLGLSICRAITEAHGGTITIHSQAGVGTEVSVRLPLRCAVSP